MVLLTSLPMTMMTFPDFEYERTLPGLMDNTSSAHLSMKSAVSINKLISSSSGNSPDLF